MSLVRKHFWTVVRRGWGGLAWPMKYGLNWTMPALVNRSVGAPGGARGAPGRRPGARASPARWEGAAFGLERFFVASLLRMREGGEARRSWLDSLFGLPIGLFHAKANRKRA